MKLLNISFTKPRYWVLGLAAVAGAGTAQAQFTGIGTTAPGASLHVKVGDTFLSSDTTGATGVNVLQVEHLRRTEESEEATYSAVMVIDPGTGIVRHRGIDELLQSSGEWIVLDEGTANERIVPRRFASSIYVDGAVVNVGSTLDVTGATTLNSTLDVGDVTAIGTDFSTDDELLIQNAAGTRVQHITVADLLSNSSYWVNAGTVAAPNYQPRGIETTMSVQGGAVAIGGTLEVNGATALNGNVNINDANTLELGSVTQVTNPIESTQVLIQDATGVVQYVTIEDLVEQNGLWEYDDNNTPTLIRPADYPTALTVNGTAANIGVATTINSTATIQQQLTLNDVPQSTVTPVPDATKVLIQGAGNVVEHVTVEDLVQDASFWAWTDNTETAIQPADFTGAVVINNTTVTIGQATQVNGTFDVTGDASVTGNTNLIGTFTVDPGADGITLEDVAQVNDVTTQGTTLPAVTDDFFDRVLITDEAGVVRYINADDLVSSAAEWVYDEANDRIYARRAFQSTPQADVWVTDAGNHVVEIAASYQFADATNQVTATGIDATAAYTMDFGSTLNVNTGASADVAFQETGSSAPWLFHDADPGTSEIGRVGINTNAPAATLHVAGNIVASNTAVTSDRRFKKDISAVSNALEAVKALRGVSYGFRADEFPNEHFDDATHIGFIAQEVREVLPQAVFERTDGFLTVDYGSITPVLAEAVEELAAKVERLESENAALRQGNTDQAVGAVSTKQFQELEARLAAMDARLEAATTGRK